MARGYRTKLDNVQIRIDPDPLEEGQGMVIGNFYSV